MTPSTDITPEILLIDIGNSRIKWHMHSELNPITPYSTPEAIPHYEPEAFIRLSNAWSAKPAPTQVRILNVAHHNILERVTQHIHHTWGGHIPIHVAQAHPHTGLQTHYNTQHIGIDRYAQILGAIAHLPNRAQYVISVGTAITIDAIHENNTHLGGVILPSHYLMRSALHQHTARLPLEGGALTSPHYPLNTHDALFTGAVFATIGAIELFIAQHPPAQLHNNPHHASPAQCLICGGNAAQLITQWQQLRPHLNDSNGHIAPPIHAPTLGLYGLLRNQ